MPPQSIPLLHVCICHTVYIYIYIYVYIVQHILTCAALPSLDPAEMVSQFKTLEILSQAGL